MNNGWPSALVLIVAFLCVTGCTVLRDRADLACDLMSAKAVSK